MAISGPYQDKHFEILIILHLALLKPPEVSSRPWMIAPVAADRRVTHLRIVFVMIPCELFYSSRMCIEDFLSNLFDLYIDPFSVKSCDVSYRTSPK